MIFFVTDCVVWDVKNTTKKNSATWRALPGEFSPSECLLTCKNSLGYPGYTSACQSVSVFVSKSNQIKSKLHFGSIQKIVHFMESIFLFEKVPNICFHPLLYQSILFA